MDVRCIRILRPYEGKEAETDTIYIDEDARYALMCSWGDSVRVKGRYDVDGVQIQPLGAIDQEGFIGRASQQLIDKLYIEYGEEVILES
ncbi:MAG: hypothetical protein ACQEQU_07330 [Spirochaetota bacterium]